MSDGRSSHLMVGSEQMLNNLTKFQYMDGIRAASGTNGISIMNRSSGKYFAFTSTSSEIWTLIGEGKSVDEMLCILQRKYPEAGERLQTDLTNLLTQLIAHELIVPTAPETLPDRSLISEPKPETGRHSNWSIPLLSRYLRQGKIYKVLWMVLAYTSLIWTDCFLKGLGFARFYRVVRSWPCERVCIGQQQTEIEAVVAIVNRAATYYLKRAWCLQRSAVTTCLLRLRGIPAELVIGVRELPFLAHAWVEVGGEVVNDRSMVQKFYKEIERC